MTTSVSDCLMTAFCSGAWSEGCMTDLRALARWRNEPLVEWFLETVTARQQHVTVSTLPTGQSTLRRRGLQQRSLRNVPEKWGTPKRTCDVRVGSKADMTGHCA